MIKASSYVIRTGFGDICRRSPFGVSDYYLAAKYLAILNLLLKTYTHCLSNATTHYCCVARRNPAHKALFLQRH